MIHFGIRIRQARHAAGLSQNELADAMVDIYDEQTVKRSAIAQWELGTIKEIEGRNLLKVAKVLGVDPAWIMFGIKDDPLVDCLVCGGIGYDHFDKKDACYACNTTGKIPASEAANYDLSVSIIPEVDGSSTKIIQRKNERRYDIFNYKNKEIRQFKSQKKGKKRCLK